MQFRCLYRGVLSALVAGVLIIGQSANAGDQSPAPFVDEAKAFAAACHDKTDDLSLGYCIGYVEAFADAFSFVHHMHEEGEMIFVCPWQDNRSVRDIIDDVVEYVNEHAVEGTPFVAVWWMFRDKYRCAP